MPETKDQSQASERGFASMDPARQRDIARKGGESVPAAKRSFAQNPELAAQAGRKGGASVPAEKRSFSQNHNLASQAGRKGGGVPGKAQLSQNPQLAAHAGRKGGESVPPKQLLRTAFLQRRRGARGRTSIALKALGWRRTNWTE